MSVARHGLRRSLLAILAALAGLIGSAAWAQDSYFDGDGNSQQQMAGFLPGALNAQSQSAAAESSDQDQKAPQPEHAPKSQSDRMFFVMPNFLTVDNETQVRPLTWKGKFSITAKGAFDPYEFAIVGVLAGIRQAENAYPAFGQGFEGYGKRYGTAFADQVDGNIMVGAVFPTFLRTDPRYFQLGKGRFARRFGYAISRIFVTLKDSGRHTFNFSEFAGNGVAVAISNLYYPAADRGLATGLNNWTTQLSIDAFGNELKEFWPDIHRYLVKKHHPDSKSQ
jgi:hypothetical protein